MRCAGPRRESMRDSNSWYSSSFVKTRVHAYSHAVVSCTSNQSHKRKLRRKRFDALHGCTKRFLVDMAFFRRDVARPICWRWSTLACVSVDRRDNRWGGEVANLACIINMTYGLHGGDLVGQSFRDLSIITGQQIDPRDDLQTIIIGPPSLVGGEGAICYRSNLWERSSWWIPR